MQDPQTYPGVTQDRGTWRPLSPWSYDRTAVPHTVTVPTRREREHDGKTPFNEAVMAG